MNENLKDLFTRLAAPFHPSDIEWRAGATKSDKSEALALAYITSRAVMDRLDEVIGPENWKDEYAPGPDGGVICGLSLRINGEWITKWDGAENTDFEAIKGGLSDAFKRVGYKWGIGRYLYKLESTWVPCEAHGKSVSLKNTPPLPSWALPNEWVAPSGTVVSRNNSPAAISAKEKEKQILKELGFDEKLEPAPVSAEPIPAKSNSTLLTKPQNAPAVPSNGKRATSWSADVVQAVLKAKLAVNAQEAVRILNQTGLDASLSPEQVVARLQPVRKS